MDELLDRTSYTPDGCWVWEGGATSAGYGEVRADGGYLYTHRLAYEHFIGPIPEGLEPDHLCNNPPCWRLDHLELVTHAENIRRAYERRGLVPCRAAGHSVAERRTSHRANGSQFTQCRACERDRYHAKKGVVIA